MPKTRPAANRKASQRTSQSRPAENSSRFAVVLCGAGVLALGLRLISQSQLAGSPLLQVPIGDGWMYDAWARAIAGGDWLGDRAYYNAPLYPHFLAILFSAVGHNLTFVRAVQAVLGASSCVLLGFAGRSFFGPRIGIVGAFLLATYPWAIFSDALIQKSSLDVFLTAAFLFAMGRFLSTRSRISLIASSVALGLQILNREAAILMYPIAVGWLFAAFRPHASLTTRARWALLFTAIVVTILTPVVFRNLLVSGELIPTTWNVGPNFYIGNRSGASGIYDPIAPGGRKRRTGRAGRHPADRTGRWTSPVSQRDFSLLVDARGS